MRSFQKLLLIFGAFVLAGLTGCAPTPPQPDFLDDTYYSDVGNHGKWQVFFSTAASVFQDESGVVHVTCYSQTYGQTTYYCNVKLVGEGVQFDVTNGNKVTLDPGVTAITRSCAEVKARNGSKVITYNCTTVKLLGDALVVEAHGNSNVIKFINPTTQAPLPAPAPTQ